MLVMPAKEIADTGWQDALREESWVRLPVPAF